MRPIKPHLLTLLLAAAVALPATVNAADAFAADARPLVKVDPGGVYKVVYDIHSGDTTAGTSTGLYYARGLFEAFQKQGVTPKQVDAHLVLHGNAAVMLLNDQAYQHATGDPFAFNPNAKIVQDLIDLGVSVEICHSAMKSKGWKPVDVLPNVVIVHDGYTRLIKLQNDGYAYIGGF